jgi:hypothetical protein
VERARALLAEVSGRIDRLLASNSETASAHVRHVVDRMCLLTDWVALLAQARWDLQQADGSEALDLVALYRKTMLDDVDRQEDLERIALQRRLATSA